MPETLPSVDVVVVGLGAAGGTAVWPLANAGLKVVGIDAGPRLTPRDYPFDEIRNDIRDSHGRWKSNMEVPTTRASTRVAATRPLGAVGPMMNAVGGTSVHWMTQSWRFLPWNFQMVSMSKARYGPNAIPKDSTSIDWPFTYDELEPYYDKHEYHVGVSGKAGNIQGTIDQRGNIYEGPRRREYPNPALRRSGFTEFMANAARSAGWHPYPGPAGIRSRKYRGNPGCTYCGFCGWTGCYTDAKVQTNVDYIPRAEATKNLKVVPLADVLRVEVDGEGRASGVTYLKGRREYFQPARVVLVAGYTYGNVRLLLLSTSRAFPKGLSNNHGQVGKHYIAHGLGSAGATGWFPGRRLNRYSGTLGQYTAVDDLDADNFDHTGLGFIGGGMCSATMEGKPIGTANATPPSVPRWGSAWKEWLSKNADSVAGVGSQLEVLSYESNFLDLDPSVRDPLGRPVIRITNDFHDNERRLSDYVQKKMVEWLKAAGAAEVWTAAPGARSLSTHAYGGTRIGDDPELNVANRWGMSHEVPNLGILGGSTFPSSAGRNPTETIQATAWRTAEYVAQNFKTITE
jgi:gluconate 2-dehydrogenase alpha chain